MIKNELIKLIKDKSARVGVIGLGYVGLPLATEFAGAGFKATGFEVDERKVGEINSGRSYIADVSSQIIKQSVDAGRLGATTDFDLLRECDAIIICVPTPQTTSAVPRTRRTLLTLLPPRPEQGYPPSRGTSRRRTRRFVFLGRG